MGYKKVSASIEAWCPAAEGKTIEATTIAFRETEKGEILVASLVKPAECFPEDGEKVKKGEKRTDGKTMPKGTVVGMSLNYALNDLKKYPLGTSFMVEWKTLKDINGGNTVWHGDLSVEEGAVQIQPAKTPF